MNDPKWANAAHSSAPGSLDRLLGIAICLPELLQLVDKCCSETHNNDDKGVLLERLTSLDERFTHWLNYYYEEDDNRIRCDGIVTESDERDERDESLLCPSFLAFNFHSLYWTCQLLLHSAITHLIKCSPKANVQAKALECFANCYAKLRRRSLDYALNATDGNVSAAKHPATRARDCCCQPPVLASERRCQKVGRVGFVPARTSCLRWRLQRDSMKRSRSVR